jgi:hypothetical protein
MFAGPFEDKILPEILRCNVLLRVYGNDGMARSREQELGVADNRCISESECRSSAVRDDTREPAVGGKRVERKRCHHEGGL